MTKRDGAMMERSHTKRKAQGLNPTSSVAELRGQRLN